MIKINAMDDIVNSLVRINPGTVAFLSTDFSDAVSHLVVPGKRNFRLSRPFEILKTPVTRRMWHEVMGSDPWIEGDRAFLELHAANSIPSDTDSYPATMVSWNDAMAFCERLSDRIGRRCSLPTELQWEYVARDGVRDLFYWRSNSVIDTPEAASFAWYRRDGERPARIYLKGVGGKKPTSSGVYDMIGLVCEYVRDGVRLTDGSLVIDNSMIPEDATDWEGVGPVRIMKGGSFLSLLANCAYLNRTPRSTDEKEYFSGFRIVVEDK